MRTSSTNYTSPLPLTKIILLLSLQNLGCVHSFQQFSFRNKRVCLTVRKTPKCILYPTFLVADCSDTFPNDTPKLYENDSVRFLLNVPVAIFINVINDLIDGQFLHVLGLFRMFKVHVLVTIHLAIFVLVCNLKLVLFLPNLTPQVLFGKKDSLPGSLTRSIPHVGPSETLFWFLKINNEVTAERASWRGC